jgi:hypothetical protein
MDEARGSTLVSIKETIIIDDVIPENLQDEYHDIVLSERSWCFLKDMTYSKGNIKYPSYGFNMLFKHPDYGVVSSLYERISVPIINSLLEKTNLEINDIYFNRSFLQLPLSQNFYRDQNGLHVDLSEPHYACVYYLNDSDGDTIIMEQTIDNTPPGSQGVDVKIHKRVTPKKGRMVVFDGRRYHCSSQPTESYRAIINFDLI